MRLCVVGDSHRYRHELLTAVKSVHRLDAILHAGDETADVEWLADRVSTPIYAVAGNWDNITDKFPEERILTSFGPPVYLTHGHRFKVKDGLTMLAARARDVGATVVVYGHTHMALAAVSEGIVFVNPGSLSAPRGRRERTFAVLEIEPRDVGDSSGEHTYDLTVSHLTSQGVLTSAQLKTRVTD